MWQIYGGCEVIGKSKGSTWVSCFWERMFTFVQTSKRDWEFYRQIWGDWINFIDELFIIVPFF
jgi:hypothetical protein